MTRQRCWFPVLGIDREDIEYALGFDPEFTEEQRETWAAAIRYILRTGAFEQLFGQVLEDALDHAKKALEIVAPEAETHAKCLDGSPAAEELLQDFRSALERVQNAITDMDGASCACFPFQFDGGNVGCRGWEGRNNPNPPVCVLCRKLHGYEPE